MLNKMSTDTTGDNTKTRDRKLSVRFTVGQTVIHYENIENLKVFINNRLCSIRQGGLSSRNKRKIRRAKDHGTTESEGDSDSNFMFSDKKSLNGTINSCNVAKDTGVQMDRKRDPARSRMLARHGHDQGRTMGMGRQTFRRDFSAPGQRNPFFSKKQDPLLLVPTHKNRGGFADWIWCIACRREQSNDHFCKGLNQYIRIDMDRLHFTIGETSDLIYRDLELKWAIVDRIRKNKSGQERDPNYLMRQCGIKSFDFQNIQQMSKHLLVLKDQAEEKKQNQLEQESHVKALEYIYSQDLEQRDTGQIGFKQLVTCFGMFDRKEIDTDLPCGDKANDQQLEQQPRITESDSPRTPVVKQTGTERKHPLEKNLQLLKHQINNKITKKKAQAARKTTRMKKKVFLQKEIDELSLKFKNASALGSKALTEGKISLYKELQKQEELALKSWTDHISVLQSVECALLQDEEDLADTTMKLDKLLALEQQLKD